MLVSIEDMRRYLNGFDFDDGLEIEIVNIIAGVQQQLETYLNRPVELVQVRETAISDSKGNLYLSVTPVRKVISYGVTVVDIEPPDASPVPYDIVPDPLIGVDGRVIDKVYNRYYVNNYRPWGIYGSIPYTKYVIEYIGGLDGSAMEQIKTSIKRVVARELSSNYVGTPGLRSGQIEETQPGDPRNVGWTKAELESLQRYRRRIVL